MTYEDSKIDSLTRTHGLHQLISQPTHLLLTSCPNSYLSSNLLLLTLVRKRNQLENLSKDELIDEVLSLESF